LIFHGQNEDTVTHIDNVFNITSPLSIFHNSCQRWPHRTTHTHSDGNSNGGWTQRANGSDHNDWCASVSTDV